VNPRVVAAGEWRTRLLPQLLTDAQRHAFAAQLALAAELGKALFPPPARTPIRFQRRTARTRRHTARRRATALPAGGGAQTYLDLGLHIRHHRLDLR